MHPCAAVSAPESRVRITVVCVVAVELAQVTSKSRLVSATAVSGLHSPPPPSDGAGVESTNVLSFFLMPIPGNRANLRLSFLATVSPHYFKGGRWHLLRFYQVNHTTIPRISHTAVASHYEPRPMRCGVRKEAANPPQNCPSIVPSGMNGPLLGPHPSLPPFAPFSSRAHFRAFPGVDGESGCAVAGAGAA